MAIVREQGPFRGSGVWVASVNCTTTNTPTNGNVLICCIGGGFMTSVASISQTNVSWSQVASASKNQYVGEVWIGIVGASAGKTATITPTSGNAVFAANLCEYSGLLTVGVTDKTASNTGSSTNADTGTTAVTSQNDELWIGCIGSNGNPSGSPTNGFTLIDGADIASGYGTSYLEKIVSSTGAANSGVTISSADWAGCIGTFKASGGGGVSIPVVMAHRRMMGVSAVPFNARFLRFTPKLTI